MGPRRARSGRRPPSAGCAARSGGRRKKPSRPGASRIAFVFGKDLSEDPEIRCVLPQLAALDYRFDRYRSRAAETGAATRRRGTLLVAGESSRRKLSAAAREAGIVAEATAWAQGLGNTPANDLGPVEFAAPGARDGPAARPDRARLRQEAHREGAHGGALAINSGSIRPPQFVIGESARRAKGTAVLVGKGITFDSGGISIKPSASMGEMKYDMMGAATVFAVLQAVRRLRLPLRVVSLAPVTENPPSGSACRPGDILRMRDGKTVEVDDTDAEGRLVLADALTYAETFGPT